MIASHELLQKLLRKNIDAFGYHLGSFQNVHEILNDAIGDWPFLDALEVITRKEEIEVLSK